MAPGTGLYSAAKVVGTTAAAVPILNHPQLGAVSVSAAMASDDPDSQVVETVDLMRRYVLEDSRAASVLADVERARRSDDAIGDTFGYVKGRLRFVNDEETAAPLQSLFAYPIVETLYRPEAIAHADVRLGDCDDYTMLGAAHLVARGVPCSFVTIAADPRDPQHFSHVYLAAYPTSGPYAGQRVPLDISHGPYPGWEYGRAYRIAEWPVDRRADILLGAVLAAGAWLLYRQLRRPN